MRTTEGTRDMDNILVPAKIWWLDDLLLEDATLDMDMSRQIEEPRDLYAMPVAELLWALENREEV